MMMRNLVVMALLPIFASCAGSVQWQTCAPDVCGISQGTLALAPGASGTVQVSLDVQGAYEDTYNFTVTGNSTVTATVSPTSAEVLDGVPFTVTVTLTMAGTATSGYESSVTLNATSADGTHSAGTSISVSVP